MIKHVNLHIKGKVQGVWYRASMQRKARELGVQGFVKNQQDGTVYAEIEGEAERLEELIRWCHIGPELAQVEQVLVEAGAVQHFEGFSVVRYIH